MDPVLSYEELAQANRAIDEATELPFRLVPDESVAPGHVLPNLDKPFLRTASQLTVKMLVKFLQHKVNNDKGQGIDLYCRVSFGHYLLASNRFLFCLCRNLL